MSPPSSSPRKRGAPPGNRNALKHGFYSRKFKKANLTSVDQANPIDLEDEITLIRLNIRHLLELGLNAKDLNEGIQILRVVSLGASTLARLIRTQHIIHPPDDEVSLAFKEALLRVQRELDLRNPSEP
jgi:hypothetical protein